MGTPVICPHCGKFFVSENEPGNPFCLCPACGRWMNIAPVIQRNQKAKTGPVKCPFCHAQLAPGSNTCLNCKRQVITGEKLPLLRRLALLPMSKKMALFSSVLGGVIVILVLVNLVVTWVTTPRDRPIGPAPTVDPADVVAARQILADFQEAEAAEAKMPLAEKLGKVGPAAAPFIQEGLEQTEGEIETLALLAALGETGDAQSADVLMDYLNDPTFGLTALRSLALLGDERAVRPMTEHFAAAVRHVTLAQALARDSLLPSNVPEESLLRQWADQATDLYRPVAALGPKALPALLEVYWRAWEWPTRDRGTEWMAHLNRVTARMMFLDGTPNEVIEGMLTEQSPPVRLAAAILLSERRGASGAQAEEWAGKLADLLAHDRAEVRRRTVWTMARITGRSFGRLNPTKNPANMRANALKEAVRWIRERTGKRLNVTPDLLTQHTGWLVVTRRTYHPARAVAREQLVGLAGADWPGARKRLQAMLALPPDAAPPVGELLEGDVRRLKPPARLVVLELLAQWRDRQAAKKMDRLTGILDNPAWMPACIAAAKTSSLRDGSASRWLGEVAGLRAETLRNEDPKEGLVPADIGRLIAPQGKAALLALHRDDRFRGKGGPLIRVYRATLDAMIAYGWPVSHWLTELGG